MRIFEDFWAYSNKSIGKGLSTFFLNPCFHSIVLYRLSCFMYHIHLTFLAKFGWYINRLLFNVDLDFRSDIEGGFRLIHGLNVVIGCEVHAGKNFTVYQGVTLGGNRKQQRMINNIITGQPYIEDNVTVYTDAKVFGPVFITNNSIIKAGTIVTKDTDIILKEPVL